MTTTLIVNSSDRTTNSTSSSDFVIRLKSAIDLEDKKRIKLQYLSLYNTFYNINNTNNKINFVDSNDTVYTATIPVGCYNMGTLATQLKASLDAVSGAGNTFTVTYSSTTKKVTIASTGNFSLLFSTGADASTSMWKILGFTSANGLSGIDTVIGTSTTSISVCNLGMPLSYIIQIRELVTDLETTSGFCGSFFIPNNVDAGELLEYVEGQTDQTIAIAKRLSRLSQLTIRITDLNGVALDLNGTEWHFVIKIE